MILITSTGELLLFYCHFLLVSFKKKIYAGLFLVLPYFYCRIECSVGLNCGQWKREGNTVSTQWRVTLGHI